MVKFLCAVTALAVVTSPALAFSGGCRTANRIIETGNSTEASAASTHGLMASATTDDDATGSVAETDAALRMVLKLRDCGENPKLEQ